MEELPPILRLVSTLPPDSLASAAVEAFTDLERPLARNPIVILGSSIFNKVLNFLGGSQTGWV